MKKSFVVMLMLLIFPLLSSAQVLLTGVTYQVSIPLADTRDFITRPGWLGFGVDARRFIKPNLSLGLSFNWNVLRQTGKAGDDYQFRTIKALPILFSGHYYLGRKKIFKPYLAISGGAYNIHKREEKTDAITTDDTWHFGLVPELGFITWTRDYLALVGNVKYHYIFASGDAGAESYLSVGVGLLWAR